MLLFLIFNLSLNNKKLFLAWALALTNLDIFYSQSSNLERIKFAFKLSKAHTHTHTRTHTSPLSSNSSLIRWKYKHTFQIHITHTLQNSQHGKGYVTRRTQFISFNFSWRTIINPNFSNSTYKQHLWLYQIRSYCFFHSQMTYQCPCNILINIDKHTLHKLEGFNIL